MASIHRYKDQTPPPPTCTGSAVMEAQQRSKGSKGQRRRQVPMQDLTPHTCLPSVTHPHVTQQAQGEH